MSDSTRQKKVARLIQKEIGQIFQSDTKGIVGNAFISVPHVKISADLSVAKIYISMMLEKDKEKILNRLNARKSEIRKLLGNQIGQQLRIVPELIFYIDHVEEDAARIESIIDSLDIPPADEDDQKDQ